MIGSLEIGTLYVNAKLQASSFKYAGEETNLRMQSEALSTLIGGCEPLNYIHAD